LLNLPHPPTHTSLLAPSNQVQHDILSSLQLHHPTVLATSFNRPNISYAVRFLDVEGQHQEQLQALQGEAEEADDAAEDHGEHTSS
jgi:superfamily II DNA helicase RecQ